MSYKNPPDYQMPWNYGLLGQIDLSLDWSNYQNKNTTSSAIALERTYYLNKDVKEGAGCIYTADLLSAINTNLVINKDPGNNIVKVNVSRYNTSYDTYDIYIPHSGLYKIEMSGSIRFRFGDTNFRKREHWEGKDLRIIDPFSWDGTETRLADLKERRHEIKILRSGGEGSIDWEGLDIDRNFYKPNINQENNMATDNPVNFPKYYPHPGEVAFVDPAQNKNMLCGLSFGKNYDKYNPYTETVGTLNNKYCNPIVIKNGYSWDYDENFTPLVATNSHGYKMCALDDYNNIVYQDSSRFKIDVEGASPHEIYMKDYYLDDKGSAYYLSGEGKISIIVWLEKGEQLYIGTCADQDKNKEGWHGALTQDIHVDLKITPYKMAKDWLFNKMGYSDSSLGSEVIKWDEKSDFLENEIDLVKFLPSDVKIDDWMQNFCKAFNLSLEQNDEGNFELNTKQDLRTNTASIIDIDAKANVKTGKSNNSLDLPSAYEIGFTVNKDEEGYTQDGGKKAIGHFETGSISEDPYNQTSNFSYNWYKDISIKKYANKKYQLPVISESEVWMVQGIRDYAEMMKKYYSGLAQRFWYKSENIMVNGFATNDIEMTLVKNEVKGMSLTYENKPNTILSNYFTLLVSDSSHYTEVECYLFPEEYNNLPYSLVKFNGDLYYPAEVNGYDPQSRKKAKLKLIRKII